MWRLLRCGDLPPNGASPEHWLTRVVQPPAPVDGARYDRCRRLLEEGSFDAGASLFAETEEKPAGLVVVTTTDREGRLELVAVRQDLRRRGLGTGLLEAAVSALRDAGVRSFRVDAVSSREQAVVALLESFGFAGRSSGSLRMRRRLSGELPSFETPPGYEVRSLRAGEEAAWVELKNACFPEDTAWQFEHFRRELSDAPCFDLERILVATQGGRLAGTTIAWEAEYGDRLEGLIHWVGVHPDHRGGGLAKALNALAMRQLAERGYAEAWLNTSRSRTAAVGLYESMGFEVYRELYTYELTL